MLEFQSPESADQNGLSESGGEEGERVAGGTSPQAADGSNPRIEAARAPEEVSESSVIVTVPPPSKRTTPHKPVKINFSGKIFFVKQYLPFIVKILRPEM